MKEILTILAIDDEPLVLEGLESLLQKQRKDSFFYKADDLDKAKDILENQHIDLILLDLAFRDSQMDGFDMARYIHQRYPQVKIIVLTTHVKIDYVERLFKSKEVHGYLDKNMDIKTLSFAIDQVMTGEFYLSPDLKEALDKGRWYTLTDRGREVVELLSKGLAKKQIAEHLYISPHTVDNHVRKLFEEFRVNTTQELVAKYVQYISASTENQNEIPPFKKTTL